MAKRLADGFSDRWIDVPPAVSRKKELGGLKLLETFREKSLNLVEYVAECLLCAVQPRRIDDNTDGDKALVFVLHPAFVAVTEFHNPRVSGGMYHVLARGGEREPIV